MAGFGRTSPLPATAAPGIWQEIERQVTGRKCSFRIRQYKRIVYEKNRPIPALRQNRINRAMRNDHLELDLDQFYPTSISVASVDKIARTAQGGGRKSFNHTRRVSHEITSVGCCVRFYVCFFP